jgi:hypothetical protein
MQQSQRKSPRRPSQPIRQSMCKVCSGTDGMSQRVGGSRASSLEPLPGVRRGGLTGPTSGGPSPP